MIVCTHQPAYQTNANRYKLLFLCFFVCSYGYHSLVHICMQVYRLINELSCGHTIYLSRCAKTSYQLLIKRKMLCWKLGLGEKKIVVEDVDCLGEDFHELLYVVFPKLKDSGSFIFAKCMSNSQFLEPFLSICLTSPRTYPITERFRLDVV